MIRTSSITPESQWSKFNPGPTAQSILRCQKRVIAAEGAVGTGKSSLFCLFIANHCAENPGARWVVIRRTYRMLKDNTIQTWLRWFPDGWSGKLGGDDNFNLDCEFQGRRARGTIMFRPAERPEDISRFMGGEYAGAALDEVTGTYKEMGLPEDIYTGLDLRLRQPGINWKCEACRTKLPLDLIPTDPNTIWTTCPACGQVRSRCMYHLFLAFNPPPPGHWVAQEFPLPEAENEMVSHFRIPPKENAINLAPGYYPSLMKRLKLKGDWIARFLDGERVPIGKQTCVFDRDVLMEMLTKARPPVTRGVLERDPLTSRIRVRPLPDGPLRVWADPRSKQEDRYVIGADAGGGLQDNDASAAIVLSRATGSVVAEWHGNLSPRAFARELAMLGWWYNDAQIVNEVEPSAHGRSACDELENLGYGNLYLQRREQNIGDPVVRRHGLPMGRFNKVRVLGIARDALEDRSGMIPNRELLLELLGFVQHPDGSYRGDEGVADDRVMGYLCALEGFRRDGVWVPVKEPIVARVMSQYLALVPGMPDKQWMAS